MDQFWRLHCQSEVWSFGVVGLYGLGDQLFEILKGFAAKEQEFLFTEEKGTDLFFNAGGDLRPSSNYLSHHTPQPPEIPEPI